jgi:hypothetical protein
MWCASFGEQDGKDYRFSFISFFFPQFDSWQSEDQMCERKKPV